MMCPPLRLATGQALIIEKGKDWMSEHPPCKVINYVAKQTGGKFEKRTLIDGTGWVVKRVG